MMLDKLLVPGRPANLDECMSWAYCLDIVAGGVFG